MGGSGFRLRGQHAVHGGQGGVIGYQVGVLGGRESLDLRQQVVGVFHHLGVDTRVLEAHLHVVGADAAGEHGEVGFVFGQLFEVDVPEPRHVAAVTLLVVHEEGHHLVARVLRHDLEVLVEAGGVLRQVQQHATARDIERLQASVLRVEHVDGLLQRGQRAPAQVGCGSRRQQVVHHVGTGVGCADGFV